MTDADIKILAGKIVEEVIISVHCYLGDLIPAEDIDGPCLFVDAEERVHKLLEKQLTQDKKL